MMPGLAVTGTVILTNFEQARRVQCVAFCVLLDCPLPGGAEFFGYTVTRLREENILSSLAHVMRLV